ncbi:hypothetical protein PDJAM_G00244750, partial [Pangasius djambal]|nr:hypothetical protein [Pangasius djambal]
ERLSKNTKTVSPTSYCYLNTAVPILRLYFYETADLCGDLRLSRQSVTSLTAALKSDSDHGTLKCMSSSTGLSMQHHRGWHHRPSPSPLCMT